MCNTCVTKKGVTLEWRAEAMFRLFSGIVTASRNNGTSYRDCWVPAEAVDPVTGEIAEFQNTYHQVRIAGRNYPAHVAVLILLHNRHPVRNREARVNEVGMHLCNNPACRNPLHLRLGTAKEDSEYKVSCGRAPSGRANGHSTKPEATPRGESHYNTRLRGEARKTAVELLKRYGECRGYAGAIASHLNTTVYTIQNLKRERLHHQDSVKESDIVLEFSPWIKVKDRPAQPKRTALERRRIAEEIRRRFNTTPVLVRSGILLQFEREYGYTANWLRMILDRRVFPEVAPEIPRPTEWGISRRRSFKHRKSIG